MYISLLKEQLGETYSVCVEGDEIFIYYPPKNPFMLCTMNGLFGEERGHYLFVADMGSLEKNIIACCLRLGKDTKMLNKHRAEIRAKLESAKDVTELEALLSTERYANMLQNNTCQEADDAKEDKFYIVRNTDNLSSLEYMKDDFKITLARVSKRSKNHYRIFYTELLRTYGYRRVWKWLRDRNVQRNPKTVLRIMKKYGISSARLYPRNHLYARFTRISLCV